MKISTISLLVSFSALLLASCGQHGHIKWALEAIQNYKNTAEMSDQTSRMKAIESALESQRGITAIVSTYQRTDDDAFKERLLFVCWNLTFSATPEIRERMAVFLQNVLEKETKDKTLRKWAATDSAYCALPSLEGVYSTMLKSSDPAMWLPGAAGLWRIKSERAVKMLINRIDVRRTNADFAIDVRWMVSQDSNQWTGAVLQKLNSK